MNNKGVRVFGIEAPFIREGDDIVGIVVDSVLEATAKDWSQMSYGGAAHELGYHLNYKNQDVIGITESVVARSAGLYVTVDEIADDIRKKFGDNATICLTDMIYSRNRFSMILKGIARAAKKLILVMESCDEVGNPRGENPFTGVDIEKYYVEICEKENCKVEILHQLRTSWNDNPNLIHPGVDYIREPIAGFIDCSLHLVGKFSHLSLHSWYCFYPVYTLADICADKNPDFGLLGCNKATEERVKLFPTVRLAEDVCFAVKDQIKKKTGKDVNVMVYGDGCFKSPAMDGWGYSSIWEFADPVTVPGCTHGVLDGSPNEVKLKAVIDESASDAEVRKKVEAGKNKNLVGKMTSMGTTPRRYTDLLASLMDLTSGSGDRATPIVLVQNYFKENI